MANNNNGMKQNNYFAKVVAYIPADIVAAYVAASGALEQAKDTVPIDQVLWVVAGALLLLTPLWILVTARDMATSHPAFRAVAGTVAFASWVFALGGPLIFGLAKAISRQHAVLADHQVLIVDFTDVPMLGVSSSLALENIILEDLDEHADGSHPRLLHQVESRDAHHVDGVSVDGPHRLCRYESHGPSLSPR